MKVTNIGSYEDHKRKVRYVAEKLRESDRYDNVNTEVEYFERGSPDPVGEIDAFGIIKNDDYKQLDLYEIKTNSKNHAISHGMHQLHRAKNFFEDLLDDEPCSFDEIRTFLLADGNKLRRVE